MRLQVPRKNQPWTDLHRRAVITLNGRMVKHCLMADEKKGIIKAHSNPLQIDPSTGDLKVVVLKGKVRIVDPLDYDVHYAYTRCDRE